MPEDIFAFLPIEVIQDHRLGVIETRVLIALFSFRGKNTNTVWPSRGKIAERCGYNEATISRALTKLVAKGWLKRTQRRGPNLFEIIVPEVTDLVTQETVTDPVINSDRSGHETVTDLVTPELKGTNQRTKNIYDTFDHQPKNGAPKRKTIQYTQEFERFWTDYPKRSGANGKGIAFKSWNARLKEGAKPEAMYQGALRYVTYCEATNIINTQYVMQCSRFVGPDKHYENGWETPRDKEAIKPPNLLGAI